MSAPPFTIPFESQADPLIRRGCGAACLAMVYKSFGKDVPSDAIWPLIAKPNRYGSVASTTHLMALHALGQGLSAVTIQARHPLEVLRRCRDAGVRAILNHSLAQGAPSGHYSVLVDIDNQHVVVHDPLLGPSRRLTHAELLALWRPSAPNSEIVGNVLIGIASNPDPIPACEFCHTNVPGKMDCPNCGKPIDLNPAATFGCIRDGCIARMWNYIACPSCDFLFNETGKFTADTRPAPTDKPLFPELPNLDRVIEETEKFCQMLLSVPANAHSADLKAQVDNLLANKARLKAAQAEEMAGLKARTDRLAAFAAASKANAEAHRKKVEELNAPPAPLDGAALGQALLKNLGFS
jgi:hypothetical protein